MTLNFWYGNEVKKSRIVALVSVLFIVAVGLVIWNPWDSCDAPQPICENFEKIQSLDGIASVQVDYETIAIDLKDGGRSSATWTVNLSENQQDSVAIESAVRAEEILQGTVVPTVELQNYSQYVLGIPRVIKTEATTGQYYELSVSPFKDLKSELRQAFMLRNAGALRVTNSSVVAIDPQDLQRIASFAKEQGFDVSLETEDQKVRYTPDPTIDMEKVALVIDAGALPNVETALYGSQMLSVHSATADSTVETSAIQQWLEQHTPPHNQPLKYSVSSPGYAKILEGWIGKVLPDSLIPVPAPLPEGTNAWKQDPNANYCTTNDVKFELSAPDAALGSRYLSVYATNISDTPCAVQGLANLEFFNEKGQPQTDVTVTADPGISPELVVIPEGETAMTTMKWGAMSTSQDPDETTRLEISLLPGLEPTKLTPQIEGADTSLDILDGAKIRISPWVQALEGWSKPN
ncbi:DUF4232 domain-containing protein [Arthrobacter sp. MYb213]|uniref:DUF4232 domain-containing protein n=1 Tax=Arthrobacter sp. MYb213 TaxID=1848595 RepID=UPI000CFD79EE|nr:DUF4232 domain-containing protein [Arthrobacter sp. MYb213]PRB72330.1 hypothetical protein CQ011_01305 [Arthrobacter sp. MYb213]